MSGFLNIFILAASGQFTQEGGDPAFQQEINIQNCINHMPECNGYDIQ
jgi:hypothetical protein